MTGKITKQTKRRLSFIMLTTLVISIFLFINIWTLFSEVIDKNREAQTLAEKIEELTDEQAYLEVEVEKLNDPEYVARYARERYLYSKDGEFTIKIPEAQ
ncbi:MAG: septum formation initiator family protein [Bacilli bacterium]